MRRFLVVGHAVPASGKWPLDDLPGAGGRVDVLCRVVGAALFLSHGIRDDTEVVLVLVADPEAPAAVRFQGSRIQRLQPDERSTAARIRQALQAAHPDPWWLEIQPGLAVAPFGLREALAETGGTPVWLHRDGRPLSEGVPEDPLFVLSDHWPFTPDEEDALGSSPQVSLGSLWYHGDHVVHVLQHACDQQGRAS